MDEQIGRMWMWAVDFIRAVYDRPWVVRFFLFLLMGKYARREFQGMVSQPNASPYFGYGLEGIEYKDRPATILELVKRGQVWEMFGE